MSRSPLFPSVVLLIAAAACNQPPTSPLVALGPEGATTVDDLVVTFTREAEDPNDDPLFTEVAWSVSTNGSGFVAVQHDGLIMPAASTAKGQTWRVEVTVTDGDLAAPETATAELTVLNSVPEMIEARLSPRTVDTFGTLTATARAVDLDRDQVDIDITWYVDGLPLDVGGNVLTGDSFTSGQEIWFVATPNDGEDSGEPLESARVVVDNYAPSITAVVVLPENPDGGSELTCVPSGWFDPDGDPEGYVYSWLVNALEVGTDAVLSPGSFGRDDLVRCQVTPDDGKDLGKPVVSPPVRIANTPPTVDGVTLSPTDPTSGVEISYVVTGAADADGDEVTTLGRWYVDGVLVHEGTTLPPFTAVRGETVTVEVTPTDGVDAGEPVVSAPVVVLNTAPSIDGITVLPETVYTDASLYPVVSAEDVDGDRITYTVQWYVNGVAAATSVTLDGDVYFDKGDEVYVELVASDGLDSSPAVSSAVITVLNSPPTMPTVSVTPEAPIPSDDLLCTIDVDSTDADDDTLTKTLTWTVDGVEFTGASTTTVPGDTIDAEDTANGETWTCTYEVDDGQDTSVATSSVEVLVWRGDRVLQTCFASGAYGPSQSDCDSAYSGTAAAGEVSVSDGLQTWTAPLSGTFRLTALGAGGGRGGGSYDGAPGARIVGEIDLDEGDTLTVLVGQMGASTSSYAAGGGGATWVLDPDGSLLMAAAGGGGNGYNYYAATGCEGQAGSVPRTGSPNYYSGCSAATTSSGDGGTLDYQYYYDGYYTDEYWFGGGGAGMFGYGAAYDSSTAAVAYVDGGYGGDDTVAGGFGGGGAGGYVYAWSTPSYDYGPYFYSSDGAGGGGGYTGGDGGYDRAGGGASYNAASNPSGTSGVNLADGRLTIELVE